MKQLASLPRIAGGLGFIILLLLTAGSESVNAQTLLGPGHAQTVNFTPPASYTFAATEV